jgi:hypothetical protein
MKEQGPLDSDSDRDELQRRLSAAERFPDQNPNPVVLRMDRDGRLIYHNDASDPIVDGSGPEGRSGASGGDAGASA